VRTSDRFVPARAPEEKRAYIQFDPLGETKLQFLHTEKL
jgi:hypothetical protein